MAFGSILAFVLQTLFANNVWYFDEWVCYFGHFAS